MLILSRFGVTIPLKDQPKDRAWGGTGSEFKCTLIFRLYLRRFCLYKVPVSMRSRASLCLLIELIYLPRTVERLGLFPAAKRLPAGSKERYKENKSRRKQPGKKAEDKCRSIGVFVLGWFFFFLFSFSRRLWYSNLRYTRIRVSILASHS